MRIIPVDGTITGLKHKLAKLKHHNDEDRVGKKPRKNKTNEYDEYN